MAKYSKQCDRCGTKLEVWLRAEVGDKVKLRAEFSEDKVGKVVPIVAVDPFPGTGVKPEYKYVAEIDSCTYRLRDEYFDVLKESGEKSPNKTHTAIASVIEKLINRQRHGNGLILIRVVIEWLEKIAQQQ